METVKRRPEGDTAKRNSATGGLIEVEDLSSDGIAWFRTVGARKGYAALIRPDKFVYALTPGRELARTATLLSNRFGGPVETAAAPEPEAAPALPQMSAQS